MKAYPLRPVASYTGWQVAKRDPAVKEFVAQQTVARVYQHIIDQARKLGAPLNRDR